MCTDMSLLLELQMRLRRAVLGGDTAEIVTAIQGEGLDPAARVGIYRHHAFATLGAALQNPFPVVCRLVDKRFFAYAAHEYLREHPPHSRCLVEYGADFADFLARFTPCEGLPYLADVARLEWALNIAATVREATPLQAEALAAVPAEQAAYVALRLQPSLSYFASPWPIDTIWQANKEDEVPPIDLASGAPSPSAFRQNRRSHDDRAQRHVRPTHQPCRPAPPGHRPVGLLSPLDPPVDVPRRHRGGVLELGADENRQLGHH